MDPNFDKMTGFNLPQPVEVAPTTPTPEGGNIVALPEKGSANAVAVTPVVAPAAPSTLPVDPPLFSPVPSRPTAGNGGSVNAPVAADDNDLIEKEWVSKAKEIVEKTKEDPYTQSQELTKFKADYMLKRYNKELKLSE